MDLDVIFANIAMKITVKTSYNKNDQVISDV